MTRLEHIKEDFKTLEGDLKECLRTPLADIWDWQEEHISWLIARVERLEKALKTIRNRTSPFEKLDNYWDSRMINECVTAALAEEDEHYEKTRANFD